MTVDITTSTPDEVLAAVREMEALNPRSLNARMGIEVIEASAERLVATMPVEGNTQPYGLLHGGASVVLAESLGSIGSALHAGPDKVVVGVDINATHHRAARAGLVTGVARSRTKLAVVSALSKLADMDGKSNEPFKPTPCYKEDGFEERPCTAQETAKQKQEWEDARKQSADNRKRTSRSFVCVRGTMKATVRSAR